MELYDTLNKFERSVYLYKDVEYDTVCEIYKKIIEINSYDKFLKEQFISIGQKYVPQPIKIFIDTNGGDLYAALGLISIINISKTPIYTISVGTAMSAGFLILISGHKRFVLENSTLLYHQIRNELNGTTKELKESLEETERLQKIMDDTILSNTKIKREQLDKIYETNVDWYISPDEAIKLKVVDEKLTNIESVL